MLNSHLPDEDKAGEDEEFESPSNTPGQWMRYVSNIWTEGGEPAVDPILWDALQVDICHVEEGEDVTIAVHVGETAWIALVAHRPEGRLACHVLSVGEDRSGVKVEARLLKLAERYDVQQVAHPRTTFMRSAEILEAAGLPTEEPPTHRSGSRSSHRRSTGS